MSFSVTINDLVHFVLINVETDEGGVDRAGRPVGASGDRRRV